MSPLGALGIGAAAGFDCSTPGDKRCADVWTDRQRVHKQCMEAQQ